LYALLNHVFSCEANIHLRFAISRKEMKVNMAIKARDKTNTHLNFRPSFLSFLVSFEIKLLTSLAIAIFTPTAATAFALELGG